MICWVSMKGIVDGSKYGKSMIPRSMKRTASIAGQAAAFEGYGLSFHIMKKYGTV